VVCTTSQYSKVCQHTHFSTNSIIDKHPLVPGQLAQSQESQDHSNNTESITTTTYRFCIFWLDHYSHLICSTMYKKKDTKEMLASKQEYEDFYSLSTITNLQVAVLAMAYNPHIPSKCLLINSIKILHCACFWGTPGWPRMYKEMGEPLLASCFHTIPSVLSLLSVVIHTLGQQTAIQTGMQH
jgi:hypothetical protein